MSTDTTLEIRMRILELSQAENTDQQIADELGIAVPTVRKWRRRGRRYGRAGLASQMGRPRIGALGSFPQPLREDIYLMRLSHPGWGPNTLVAELARDRHWQEKDQPSRSSIARYLKEQNLVRVYERHAELPQTRRKTAPAPHDIWEIDARGEEHIPEVGVVSLIDVKDICSRAHLLSYPVVLGKHRRQHHPSTENYQMALRLAFTDWGLPKQVHVDHASVFFDNVSKSPFPSRFHLWLTALGIDLTFSRRYRATDQGAVEKSHQVWAAQVTQGQTFDSWDSLYFALRDRRDFLNSALPCATLDGLPPLLAFPAAQHSGRDYRPEWEADLMDMDRVFAYLRQGRWFRKASKDGTISLGGNVLYIGEKLAHQDLEIQVHPEERTFLFFDARGELVASCSPSKFTKENLMGHISTMFQLPFFQLALPFSGEAQQVIRLFRTMSVTT
jgi:transposase InsO family protein